MARKYSSKAAETSLNSAITSSATSMVVGSTTGWPTSYPFTLIIDPDTSKEEIVTVSNVGGTTVTLSERGADGTTASAHDAAAQVKHGVSARDFSEPQVHIDATVAHGATGAVVGTTNFQNLTNKTLTSPSISGGTIDATTLKRGGVDAVITSDTRLTDTRTPTDLTVSTGKIVDAAVTTVKLADSAVTAAKIADGTIGTVELADAAVTNVKLANSSVTVGSTAIALGGTAAEVAGLTLNGGTIKAGTNLINSGSILTGVVNGTSMLQGGIQLADVSTAQALTNKTIDGVAGSTLAAERTAWTSYTPDFQMTGGTGSQPSVGTGGSRTGFYKQVGKTVYFRARIGIGTPAGGDIGGGVGVLTISLPVTCASAYTATAYQTFGQWTAAAINGASIIYGSGVLEPYNTSCVALVTHTTAHDYVTRAFMRGTAVVWYNTSYIEISGTYEAA